MKKLIFLSILILFLSFSDTTQSRIGSFFLTTSTQEYEVEWCKQNNIATTDENPNILMWGGWSGQPDFIAINRIIDWHHERGLKIGMVIRENEEIYLNPDNIYYIDHEIDLSCLYSRWYFEQTATLYREMFSRLPRDSVIVWSPYFSSLHHARDRVYKSYKKWLKEVCVFGQTYISSLQDGVGCTGASNVPPYWGDRIPKTMDYVKALHLIRAHYLACKDSRNVIPRVNIEIFRLNESKTQWLFAPVDRIQKQNEYEEKYCEEKDCGPSWILTNGGMGDNYNNNEFLNGGKIK
jgi:hypothetical protein